MIRILIADDHSVVRRGLRQIVSENPGMVVAGEASNGQEVLDIVQREDFDVVVMDIAMPGRGGLNTLRELKKLKPSLKVLIFSIYSEAQYAVRCLRDGAYAYLSKVNAPEELIQAIQTVARGERYITPSLANKLAAYLESDSGRLPHERLSDREFQVLVLMGKGKPIRDIARELCLSVKTISTYRARILEKMALKTNAELIRYAIQHGLAD